MARTLATEAPPIVSADGVAMSVGQTVYGVDIDCRGDRIPAVEPLLIVQLDLGPNRRVRLRRSRGTEWVWSAQESRGTCKTSDHYLYASFSLARQAAVDAAKAASAEAQRNVEASRKAIESARKDAQKSIARARGEYRNRQTAMRDREAKIKRLSSMRKPASFGRK